MAHRKKRIVRIGRILVLFAIAAGIAAAWGIAHGCEVNVLRWEDIPADERSYVSAG